jgi:hypothetical protein
MLYISLIVSALFLLTVNWFAGRARSAGISIVCSSAAFVVGPAFLMCVLPAVALQAVLICVATIIWRATHRGPAFFLLLSCGATTIAYGVSGAMALRYEREYARLRGRYPYESMEGRLPAPRAVPRGTSLPAATVERLSRLEGEIAEHANGYREFQLKSLHERAVSLFINSPGFGVMRMIRPSESGLAVNLRRETVPLEPGPRSTSGWSPGELQLLPDAEEISLSRMLEDSVIDFVNPRGFGYFKDRRHVTGFETHRFSRVPAPPAIRWKVQSLELVSLLLHDEPEVYVSSRLPRMDRLDGVPTRVLDRFERLGLDVLRQGEDLFTTQEGAGARMLGAVRSTIQCIGCHSGERGDLLGAFSYTLRSDEP